MRSCHSQSILRLRQVLASRVVALNDLTIHRRSSMVSLIRDMRATKRQQPLLFWGSIGAFLFGICTIIQTVTAVWSLQLAFAASYYTIETAARDLCLETFRVDNF